MTPRLEDLPPAMRRQAEAKIGMQSSRPRKPPEDREHQEQVTVVEWARLCLPTLAEHMTAIPNGGHRLASVAGKLKAEGVSPGYPDLLVDLPRGRFHGLRIEMKAPGGPVRDNQREWIARLIEAGYRARVCVGATEAIDEIQGYWKLGPYHLPEVPHD